MKNRSFYCQRISAKNLKQLKIWIESIFKNLNDQNLNKFIINVKTIRVSMLDEPPCIYTFYSAFAAST